MVQPAGSFDSGPAIDARQLPDADPNAPDGSGGAGKCDFSGRWIVAQTTFSTALSATQTAVNWFYHEVSQSGDTFTIDYSLSCGFRVTGTTTVGLPDATLVALAERSSSVGRQGTFSDLGDGTCALSVDRIYDIRGANMDMYLRDHWSVGDTPIALGDLPALPENGALEDWDNDNMHGITMQTGLGNRFVGQRDWNEHAGVVPYGADRFGGEGVVTVTWDGQESVSTQTPLILHTTSTPQNPGRASYARVGSELVIIPGDLLRSCKNVQRLALELFPNP